VRTQRKQFYRELIALRQLRDEFWNAVESAYVREARGLTRQYQFQDAFNQASSHSGLGCQTALAFATCRGPRRGAAAFELPPPLVANSTHDQHERFGNCP
jgi:hypothetical protein